MRFVRRFALLGSLALAACAPAAPTPVNTGGSTQPAEVRADQQSLRVLAAGLIGNPTPQSSNSNAYQFFPMYDSVTTFGENATVRPFVAEKWDLSADGLSWTLKIRSDLKFSNGDPLTAEDVAFSIGQILEKRWPQLTYIATVNSARATDATTVVLAMKQIDMTIPSGLTYVWIVPKKYFEQVGFEAFVQKPIVSGPYELAEFKVADQIRYKKRALDHPFRKVVLDEIQIRALPDGGQQANGLRTGEAHIVAGSLLTADQADALKAEGVTIVNKPTGIGGVRLTQSVAEAKKSPLTDKRVRLALNYAVDKENLVKTVFKSYGQPDGQFSLPGSQYHDPSVKPIPFDQAMAKRLLAEAGYPNGFKLELDYSTGMTNPIVLQAIQGYFRDIGVEVNLSSFEQGIFVDKVYGRNGQTINELSIGGNGDTNGFNTGTRVFIGCGKPSTAQFFYCNPEWDRLMDAAYAERDDAKRRQVFLQANKTMREDYWLVFLYTSDSLLGHTSKVRGWKIPMPLSFNFDEVYLVK